MADAPDNPLAPHTRPPYYAGQPIEFAGYVDDFDRTICAMEFSLDDGASWTAYPTAAVDKSRGVNWRFVYTPETPGRYLLKVRPVTEDGEPSTLVAGFAFEALPAGGTYGDARIRAVGGSFKDARIFRSRELANLTGEEAAFLSGALGIATIYDLRTASEVAAHPEPYIVGMRTVALEPSTEHRRKDSDKRLIAGQGQVYTPSSSPESRRKDLELDAWLTRAAALCRSGKKEEIAAFCGELAQHVADAEMDASERQLLLLQVLSAVLAAAGRSGVDVAPAFPGLHMEWVLQPADITAGVEQLGTLMQFVSDAVRREVATSGSELIAQAVAYTQSNYADKDLSLESLCALFQISQTQFSLLFKREMGTSFLQYLLDQRIAAAQKLLRETSMKIYQIAEETGFGDASYFSYCFKQRCGLSPKEYRMQGGA